MLHLEGAQAGLSWLTVLKKRDRYREVFDNFDAAKIIHYDESKRQELLADAGIIRNKLKVNAVIVNAGAYIRTQQEFGSFDAYLWGFVDNTPLCYAFMQATGMINDHEPRCFRAEQLNFFSFYTVLSNLLAGSFLIYLGLSNSHSKRTEYLRGAVTLYMFMTGVIFAVLLAGRCSRWSMLYTPLFAAR